MPYKNISELPDQVKVLPAEAQRQFMRVVNSALDAEDSEEVAFRKAWGVINRSYEKNDKDEWVKKMEDSGRFMVPFADLAEDKWFMVFPIGKTIHHMGTKKELTINDAIEMVSNFKSNIPDYDLPINTLHRDELGVYGVIGDVRIGNNRIEWQPRFRDGAIEELQQKGYKYASPEVAWSGYEGVYDGKKHNNVLLGIAITPRPRLGRGTQVFSDDGIVDYESTEDGQQQLVDELMRLATVRPELTARVKSLFAEIEERNTEKENKESNMNEEEMAVQNDTPAVDARLQEKDAEITALQEEKAKLETELAQYAEKVRLAEAAEVQARLEKRKAEFADVAKGMDLDEAFGDELMWLNDADGTENKAHYEKMVATIKALRERVNTSALFAETGHDGQDYANPEAKLERLAKEKAEATGVAYAQALTLVINDNPELYAEYSRKVSVKEK